MVAGIWFSHPVFHNQPSKYICTVSNKVKENDEVYKKSAFFRQWECLHPLSWEAKGLLCSINQKFDGSENLRTPQQNLVRTYVQSGQYIWTSLNRTV